MVEINGQTRRLLYNRLYAEGEIRSETEPVLVVPRSAVLAPGPTATAYVDAGNGSYQQRTLRLGRSGDDGWEVLEGLQEGELVVSAGNMLVDAQAQLNRSATTPDVPASKDPADSLPAPDALTTSQSESVTALFTTVDAVTAALAADNVEQFNQESTGLHAVLGRLQTAFAAAPSWQPYVEPVARSGHFTPAQTLQDARKAFFPFSKAVVEFARALRRLEAGPARDVRLYTCPMTNRAFEGAPREGFWVQLRPPLRNPFFGSEMLDCGTEIQD
jgi:Cu(I)/Ag(I) efflux system membrane fusion protein